MYAVGKYNKDVLELIESGQGLKEKGAVVFGDKKEAVEWARHNMNPPVQIFKLTGSFDSSVYRREEGLKYRTMYRLKKRVQISMMLFEYPTNGSGDSEPVS